MTRLRPKADCEHTTGVCRGCPERPRNTPMRENALNKTGVNFRKKNNNPLRYSNSYYMKSSIGLLLVCVLV